MDPHDDGALLEGYNLFCDANAVDDPAGHLPPPSVFRIWMTTGWSGHPREMWGARDDSGTLTGWYKLELPDKENLHRAYLTLIVHPAARRRGLGRELLAHASERAAAAGRTMLAGSAWLGTAGDAFARAVGAVPALAEIRRVQVLADIKLGELDRLRDEAKQASAGYSVIRWTEPVPEEYIKPMVAVLTGFEDAPRSENSERAQVSEQRIREDNERFLKAGQRGYTVAARHDATGALAAASQVFISPDDAEWASQGLTAVVREHRGRRLGLLTKIAMLDWLAEAEPQITHIETWNAEVNGYMIGVNEALGYQVLGVPNQDYELALSG